MKIVADLDGLRPVVENCEHHIPGDWVPASNTDMDPMLADFIACLQVCVVINLSYFMVLHKSCIYTKVQQN